MTSFLGIALRNAARGFRVIPLKGKTGFLKDWPSLATTDESTIRAWAAKYPEANCGVAGGSDVIILDTDRLSRLIEVCGPRWAEWSRTYSVSSGRPDRAHFYYVATEEVLVFGNKRWKEQEIDGNIFEIKGRGALVVAEGSVHPDTGGVYCITQHLPLIPFPAEMFAILKDHWSKQNPTGKRQWNLPVHDGEGRDDFLIQQAGKLRNVGASEEVIRIHLGELNADPAVMADPKSEGDLDRIARSAARYDVPAPPPTVLLGGRRPGGAVEVVELEVAEKSARPVFPDESWDGTIFGAFADIVCRGTFIRKRLASESFRAITGAIAGDQVTCGLAGVRLRDYFAIIAFRQSGKSYGLDRSVDFYTKTTLRSVFEPLLILAGGDNVYRSTGIGAQRFLPGSSNSFVDELTREERKKKPTKDPAIEVKITNKWEPTARYITIQGEAMALFARLCNPDWSGQTLSALVTDLYDSLDAEVPITGDRAAPKIPIRLQYSMLLCTQPQIWKKYMAAHMMDSGLFGRFYIVGSEYKPKRVLLPDYEASGELFQDHFGALRRDVFARLDYLKDHPLLMTIAPEAKRRIQEWENALPDEDDLGRDLSSRMGLHVWRAAMARAWGAMPQRLEITLDDADAAIRLGEYQVKMRQYYSAIPGDSPRALHLNAVTMAIEQAGQISMRDCRKQVRGDRWPEDFEWAIDRLQRRGQIVIRDMPKKQRMLCWVK